MITLGSPLPSLITLFSILSESPWCKGSLHWAVSIFVLMSIMTFRKKWKKIMHYMHVCEYLDSAKRTELPWYKSTCINLVFKSNRSLTCLLQSTSGIQRITHKLIFVSAVGSEQCWWKSWTDVLNLRTFWVNSYYLPCFSNASLIFQDVTFLTVCFTWECKRLAVSSCSQKGWH